MPACLTSYNLHTGCSVLFLARISHLLLIHTTLAEYIPTMDDTPKTWLVVGASRGIGLEFVRQNIAQGHRVIATTRGFSIGLDAIHRDALDRLNILTCDVSSNESINVCPGLLYPLFKKGHTHFPGKTFIEQFIQAGETKIDYAVINAGILEYPNVSMPPPHT